MRRYASWRDNLLKLWPWQMCHLSSMLYPSEPMVANNLENSDLNYAPENVCSSAHSWVGSMAVCRGTNLAASGAGADHWQKCWSLMFIEKVRYACDNITTKICWIKQINIDTTLDKLEALKEVIVLALDMEDECTESDKEKHASSSRNNNAD
ncbi:hypothetical protein Tco_0812310 [Tanacetum coccineum]